jgi:tRNA(fMet)-specific endonuclease VapC
MTPRYLLDTNTVSHALKGHPAVIRRLVALPTASICISAITEGELRFGLAKRQNSRRLRAAIEAFLSRVDVLPWDSKTAARYGPLRAAQTRKGKPGHADSRPGHRGRGDNCHQ